MLCVNGDSFKVSHTVTQVDCRLDHLRSSHHLGSVCGRLEKYKAKTEVAAIMVFIGAPQYNCTHSDQAAT